MDGAGPSLCSTVAKPAPLLADVEVRIGDTPPTAGLAAGAAITANTVCDMRSLVADQWAGVNCTSAPVQGRYISVQATSSASGLKLAVCEIQAFGVRSGEGAGMLWDLLGWPWVCTCPRGHCMHCRSSGTATYPGMQCCCGASTLCVSPSAHARSATCLPAHQRGRGQERSAEHHPLRRRVCCGRLNRKHRARRLLHLHPHKRQRCKSILVGAHVGRGRASDRATCPPGRPAGCDAVCRSSLCSLASWPSRYVDLGSPTNVYGVRIFGRTDCCYDRHADYEVRPACPPVAAFICMGSGGRAMLGAGANWQHAAVAQQCRCRHDHDQQPVRRSGRHYPGLRHCETARLCPAL